MKNYLTGAALAVLIGIAGCSDSDTVPQGDPNTKLKSDMRGYHAPAGVMIGTEETAHWVKAALSGYRSTNDSDMPAKVSLVEGMKRCTFTPPAEGEVLANVHFGSSRMDTSIYAFTNKDIANRTQKMIEAVRQTKEKPHSYASPSSDQLYAIDVVVTDTSGPLYLVLQHSGGGVLWNIHAAPGVEIAKVAALSASGTSAVANLPDTVPVEFMSADIAKRCKIFPIRRPAAHWSFVKNTKKAGNSSFGAQLKEKLAENRKMQRKYSGWFEDNFGVPSEKNVIGVAQASHALVGPLPASPEERIAFRPLKGAEVRMITEDHVLVTSEREYRARQDEMINALAEKMIGGDIKSLYGGS